MVDYGCKMKSFFLVKVSNNVALFFRYFLPDFSGLTKKHCLLAMFPEGRQTRKHCFLAMFPKGRQTRKHCFITVFLEGRQTRKHCFLAMFPEGEGSLGNGRGFIGYPKGRNRDIKLVN